MGKNFTFWLTDETEQLLGNIEGKGTLINKLITEYFSNDIENLKKRASNLNQELEMVNNKMEKIRERENQTIMQKRIMGAKSAEQQKRKFYSAIINKALRENKISQEEWESCFGLDGILIDRVKELLTC